MSAISITAPQVTDDELRLEQGTYTDQEISDMNRDLYGGPLPDPITATDQVLEEFRQCIEDFPPDVNEAYLEAVERAPHLICKESDPQWFLSSGTLRTAAERCANYWELRRWLFGERAWLPMTATGNGALSPQDVELLATGFCTLLPQEDRHGRGLLCFQVPPKPLNADRLAMARVAFYVLSLALWSRPLVARNGIVVVANTRHYTMARYDRKFIKSIAYLFTGWHPVMARAFHVTAPSGSKSCLTLVLPYLRSFMTRHVRQRFRVHRGTLIQCALDLNDYGIATHSLPVEMGGEFHKEQFQEWLQTIVQPKEICREKDFVASFGMDDYFYSSNGSLMLSFDDFDGTTLEASPRGTGSTASVSEMAEAARSP